MSLVAHTYRPTCKAPVPIPVLSCEDRQRITAELVAAGIHPSKGGMIGLVKAVTAFNMKAPPGGWRKFCRAIGLDAPHYVNLSGYKGNPGAITVSVDGFAYIQAKATARALNEATEAS